MLKEQGFGKPAKIEPPNIEPLEASLLNQKAGVPKPVEAPRPGLKLTHEQMLEYLGQLEAFMIRKGSERSALLIGRLREQLARKRSR